MSKRDFPEDARDLWDVMAKALMLRAGGNVTVSQAERDQAANTEAELVLLPDGAVQFRIERN